MINFGGKKIIFLFFSVITIMLSGCSYFFRMYKSSEKVEDNRFYDKQLKNNKKVETNFLRKKSGFYIKNGNRYYKNGIGTGGGLGNGGGDF